MKKKSNTIRLMILASVLSVALLLFSFRLLDMQYIHAEQYSAEGQTTGNPTVVIPAARGEILDRNGIPLAVNRESYNIIFDRAYMAYREINPVIERLITLLESTGENYHDILPLTKTEPFEFTADTAETERLISGLHLAHYATAANCYDNMIGAYDLQAYSADRMLQRKIMGVRYTMAMKDFSIINPYTVAEDISIQPVQKIKEASGVLPGITVETGAVREYPLPEVAPYIIGSIGPIYAEEWETLKDDNYQLSAKVGKAGIEQKMEAFLRGKDGKKEIIQTEDENGETVTTEKIIAEPENGNTVVLSLDSKLQKILQDELADYVEAKKAQRGQCSGGAIVVQDVRTGEILAAPTYPSYDMETYENDYQSLVSDPDKPLFNRALNGIYPPGSTFKPVSALIGLQTGKITEEETILCNYKYDRIKDIGFYCMHADGHLNVTQAIARSCNIFFYEVGWRVGIDTLNQYTKLFGLGVETGVEIGESSGILAGQEYRNSLNVSDELKAWNVGDTVQAAIGQSDNAFTPLQLSTYAATVANGGTRYQTHLVREVKSYDMKNTVAEPYKKVLSTAGIDEEHFEVVKNGMLSVTTEGTASLLSHYPISIGGKTGTAQTGVKGEIDNAVFVAFAPFDNPEISVSIVIEHGGFGSSLTSLAERIFNAYFFGSADPDAEDTQDDEEPADGDTQNNDSHTGDTQSNGGAADDTQRNSSSSPQSGDTGSSDAALPQDDTQTDDGNAQGDGTAPENDAPEPPVEENPGDSSGLPAENLSASRNGGGRRHTMTPIAATPTKRKFG